MKAVNIHNDGVNKMNDKITTSRHIFIQLKTLMIDDPFRILLFVIYFVLMYLMCLFSLFLVSYNMNYVCIEHSIFTTGC